VVKVFEYLMLDHNSDESALGLASLQTVHKCKLFKISAEHSQGNRVCFV